MTKALTDEEKEQKRIEREEEDSGVVVVPSDAKDVYTYAYDPADTSAENRGLIVKSPLYSSEKTGELFKKGGVPGPGRPKKKTEEAILRATAEAATPDELQQVLRGLIMHKSWRAQVAGVKLILENTLGLPVQRVITENDAFSSLLEAIRAKREAE